MEGKGLRSGSSLKRRPAMKDLVERLKWDATISSIISRDLARLSRNTQFTLELTALCHRCNVQIVTLMDGDIRYETAADKLTTTSKAMVTQYYRDSVSDNLRNYYARERRNGRLTHHRPPLGLRIVGSTPNLRFEASEDIDTVREIIAMLGDSKSYREITESLRSQGRGARDVKGGPVPLQPYHVRDVAKNLKLYDGFVEDALLGRAIARGGDRAAHTFNGPRSRHRRPILWRLLTCAQCGQRWWAAEHWGRGRKTMHVSYRHANVLCDSGTRVSGAKLNLQIWPVLDGLAQFVAQHPEEARQLLSRRREPAGPTPADKRKALENRLSNLERAYVAEEIRKESYLPLKREIEGELKELGHAPDPIPMRVPSFEDLRTMLAETSWPDLARDYPEQLNNLLRDLFERITIDRESRLAFYPRDEIRSLYEAALLVE